MMISQAAGADPPFHDRVRSGGLRSGEQDPDLSARNTSSNIAVNFVSR
jgi:hypothetical protein